MKISHILVATCCGLLGSLSHVQADNSASELLHTIAAEAPGKEHTLNELAIALDELLGLERHAADNLITKPNVRRLDGGNTITSVVTRIVQILSKFKGRIDNKANSQAINGLQTAIDDFTTDLAGKADQTALALKADASALDDKADASALALKADASALALKADQTDLEDLNRTLQTFHAVIHDPTALQELQQIETELNSGETTNAAASTDQSNEDAPVTDAPVMDDSGPFQNGFAGYNEIACGVPDDISSEFPADMPALAELIGIKEGCEQCSFDLYKVMDVCTPVPDDAVCPDSCVVTVEGTPRCADPSDTASMSICDACALTPNGSDMSCVLKQNPYTVQEMACFDVTPMCAYFQNMFNEGPPSDGPSPSGDGLTSAWPLISSANLEAVCPPNNHEGTGYNTQMAQDGAYDLIKYNNDATLDCNVCIGIDSATWPCMSESEVPPPMINDCFDYTMVCAAYN